MYSGIDFFHFRFFAGGAFGSRNSSSSVLNDVALSEPRWRFDLDFEDRRDTDAPVVVLLAAS